RGDGEVVGAQPQGWQPEQQPEHDRGDEPDDRGEPQRVAVVGHDRRAVGTDERRADVAEVEQAGEAELDVEADRGERVHAARDADHVAQPVDGRGAEVDRQHHAALVRTPNTPWGRNSRTSTSVPRATTILRSASSQKVDTSDTMPTNRPPTIAP